MFKFYQKWKERRKLREEQAEAVRQDLKKKEAENLQREMEEARQTQKAFEERRAIYRQGLQNLVIHQVEDKFDVVVHIEKARQDGDRVIGFVALAKGSHLIIQKASSTTNPVAWRDLEIGETIKAGDRLLSPDGSSWVPIDRDMSTVVTEHTRIVQRRVLK
jgi:hypothetical protein